MMDYDGENIPIWNFHNPAQTIYYSTGMISFPMGNTRNRSITEQIGTTNEQHLDLLFLGCGDLRNVLCTVSELSQRRPHHCPKSIDIHLNDYDPTILPRNAIILDIIGYINPDIPDDMDFLWNVSYNMTLSKSHGDRLRQVITSLINIDQNDENGITLRFQDSRTEQECLSVWKDWLELNLDVETVKEERHEFNINQLASHEGILEHLLEKVGLAICSKSEFVKTSMRYWQQEVDHWTEKASTTDDSDFINPTLISPFEHIWKLNVNSSPFEGYMPFDPGDIMRHKSLTAVCKETLKMWVKRFQTFNKKHPVKISLWAGDALWLCTSGLPSEMLFDVIDTSNVSDYVGLLNVLICCGPRLKKERESMLHTSSMTLWSGNCESVEDYYTKSIGINTNLLPTVLGLHLAVDFDLGNRRLPDNGELAEASLHWVKADTKRSILTLDKESDIITALWNLTKQCFNLVKDLEAADIYGAPLSSPLTLLRIIHQMSPLVRGGAARIFYLLESEVPYDFYQKHGFTWKLLKSIAMQDGEPIIEVEVQMKITVNQVAHSCSQIPMIVFLDQKDNVHLKILLNRFENCPVMYNTIRFNIKEDTVTFHMLERDWEIIQPNFLLHIAQYRGLQTFRCKPVELRNDEKISVHRVDPVATFGLFAVQEFQVCDVPSPLLEIVKIEEDDNLYKAELNILDSEKCNAKDMSVDFTPHSSPTEVDIYFSGVRGSNLRFSCPVSASSSNFRVSKKKNKVTCEIGKDGNMVSGEMTLINPAQVQFHTMTRWDAEADNLEWTCYQMLRSKSDFLMELSLTDQRGPPFYRLRCIITEILNEHFKGSSKDPCLYHVGLTENHEDDTEGFFLKVHGLIYKWNHLPYEKCIFSEHPKRNNDAEKAKSFAREVFGCTCHYIFTLPEEIELFRRMFYINAARTEQENPATSAWRNTFICPLYPREGLLNKKPDNIFEAALRKKFFF
ncbi:uncharacterized protein LOC110240393 [Exaiptasia diaphana]|uniref:DUF4470 domain-containing protein n=1 Tax=Exaiptasia diaphana TaxID=2652724 RepID=A0A913YLW5_EXADI|nr:uncharacterized protein LOC110240393 [Exaiptasia diaphana]